MDEFRLLVVFPGAFEDTLSGDVITAKVSDATRPAYEALSYTWADETGDVQKTSEFLCDDDHSIIRITGNCAAAIRRLRLPDRKRSLWIDAICINQSNELERTFQVSMMSRIYLQALRVVVYTGEGTYQTDKLFDWLNALKTRDLDILLKWDLDCLAGEALISFEKYWGVAKERFSELFSNPAENEFEFSQEEFMELAEKYSSRRWFKRVWVLQVSLLDVRNTTVMCGTKTTTAIRALHALSRMYKGESGAEIRIFVLMRKNVKVNRSHLLDVLIETRNREAGDPRDKIFGVLSISNYLDKGLFPELKAEYGMTAPEVYEHYSEKFIKHHGLGFFLSLIKSVPKLRGLPSWAADWTVPWPNYKAVEGRDFAAGSRQSNLGDSQADFSTEHGYGMLTVRRPRIIKGYFTRNGHIDDEKDIRMEEVDSLRDGEILVEMYPGLAVLLRREAEYHTFIQVCPHALSESGVEELVGKWNRVVLDGEGFKDSTSSVYLGPVEVLKIL